MNKNIIIVLGGAIVIAVLVAVLVQLTLGGKKEPPPTIEEAKVEILVANRDLRMGDELKLGDVRWQSWPKAALFAGAVIRRDGEAADSVFEGRLARDITKDEPFNKMALLREAKGNLVAASLEPGMRAVAIEVSASAMVGGFIGPGDMVDIILTYKQSMRPDKDDVLARRLVEKNLDKLATETIVQNVKILAVDQMATRPEDETFKVGKTVTLSLTSRDAERVALAQEMGALTLSLRGVGDDVVVKKDWPTISDVRLTKVDDEIFEEYENKKNDTGIPSNIMRIYNGDEVQSFPTR